MTKSDIHLDSLIVPVVKCCKSFLIVCNLQPFSNWTMIVKLMFEFCHVYKYSMIQKSQRRFFLQDIDGNIGTSFTLNSVLYDDFMIAFQP